MINIKSDSRKIKKGDIFVALKGFNSNGEDYIESAIKLGASQVIVESDNKYSVPTLKVSDTREYLNKYLSDNYGDILNNMTLIGITGTNGKTTSAYLIYQMLNKLGIKCAYIGTIGYYLDKKIFSLPNTSPDICDLYDLIINAHDNSYDTVVMEVSSQGLDMGRFKNIKFNYGIFTNLTQDHLDYHGNMENYAKAKRILFDNLKDNGISIINSDDKYAFYFKTKNYVDYGYSAANYKIQNVELGYKTKFELNINGNTYNIESKLIGEFNIYNLTCSIALLNLMGFELEKIKEVVLDISAPAGRLDIINYKDNLIIVDYAHTPDAMENIYKTINKVKIGNIYTVFGCTGNRDRTKRPIMMSIATNNSKEVIITSDDLHDEEFSDILKDMLDNNKNNNYIVEPSRSKAIEKGIKLLKSNDILLVLGKGHEEFIIVKDKKIPFNDKKIIENLIKEPIKE